MYIWYTFLFTDFDASYTSELGGIIIDKYTLSQGFMSFEDKNMPMRCPTVDYAFTMFF